MSLGDKVSVLGMVFDAPEATRTFPAVLGRGYMHKYEVPGCVQFVLVIYDV